MELSFEQFKPYLMLCLTVMYSFFALLGAYHILSTILSAIKRNYLYMGRSYAYVLYRHEGDVSVPIGVGYRRHPPNQREVQQLARYYNSLNCKEEDKADIFQTFANLKKADLLKAEDGKRKDHREADSIDDEDEENACLIPNDDLECLLNTASTITNNS